MTRERFLELQREYRKHVKTIRRCQDFETITFTFHPDADQARREVAAMVPELLDELKKVVK